MKVGDLVVYRFQGPGLNPWAKLPGVIVRQIPGTDEVQCVKWLNGEYGSLPKRKLKPYEDRNIGNGLL